MMPTRVLLRVGVAALVLAAATASTAEELPLPDDPTAIVMNFENVELTAFVKFVSKVTGRNFVYGDRISGTVSVMSPTPVTPEQAFRLFQSVLATQGLTTVDEGVVTRIVAMKDARTAGASVIEEDDYGVGFATRLMPLRYVTATDVARVLAPQVSKDGSIVPYEGTNTVIVSDTSSNLARIADIVRVMDIPGHEQMVSVVPLLHADAARTTEQILEILMSGAGAPARRRADDKAAPAGQAQGLGFKITPDERTNSLVIMAPSVEMKRIRAMARSLDVELRPGEESVHVYYVRHADAESLVEVLSGILRGSTSQTGARRERREAGTSSAQAPAAGAPPSASNEDMSITADRATNSVIVDAGAQKWKTIRSLLERLDIPRPQVFIEAILIEASTSRAKALGLDFQGAIDVGDGDVLLRSNVAQIAQAFINPLSLGGLVAAAASDKVVQLPDGTELPANYALLQALDATSEIEVLSAPTLLTLDNQEAEIIVGQNIPFVTGRASDIANIENVFTTIERRDVGIKLNVRPQVAEGDIVVLEVRQEVSALVPNRLLDESIALVGPTTTIRSASTTVSVGDGRTVVIGGLMSQRVQDTQSKIPLLGDIPGLGRLFRYDRKDNEKVNLIVFLTPHVIRSPRDLEQISKGRRDGFRGEMRDPAAPLPGDDAPVLPGSALPLEQTSAASAPVDVAAAPREVPAAPGVAAVSAPAHDENPSPTRSDTSRDESTYRHAMREKNSRIFPLNRDTRSRAPF